jgi:ubiquinone/menaquinone biosynthesis C-methylase UbiE
MTDIHVSFQNADRTTEAETLFRFLDEVSALDSIQSYRQQMLELHPPRSSDHVLDIGCGIGNSTLDLASKVGEAGLITGIDKSETLIAEARRRAEGLDMPVAFQVGDACRLDHPDDHFDLCRIERVLMYIETPERALDEMIRVLRPGGHFALFEFDYDCIVVDAPDKPLTKRIIQLASGSIPSPWIGRRLPGLLRKRGGRNLTVTPYVIFTPLDQFRRVMDGTTRNAIGQGDLEAAAVDRWWNDLERSESDGAFFAGFLGFLVCGDSETRDQ